MRASPEKKEEKERVRLALLRATLQLAAAHGFASLGLREVAREAGIAPTSFYRHFADMDELGRALIEEFVSPVLSELENSLRMATEAQGDVEAALVDAVIRIADRDREPARFLLAEQAGAFPSFRSALRQKLEHLGNAVHAATGGEGPSLLAQAAVVLLLDGLNRALESPAGSDPQARAELSAELLETLRSILVARGPTRDGPLPQDKRRSP